MNPAIEQPVQLHGKLEYLYRKGAVGPLAERAYSRILEANPDLHTLEDKLVHIANENASLRSRCGRDLSGRRPTSRVQKRVRFVLSHLCRYQWCRGSAHRHGHRR